MNAAAWLALAFPSASSERVVVSHDDLVVERSCTLVFPQAPLADAGERGVVRIVADGVTIECEGTLRGAPEDAAGDTLAGTGIVVVARGVTLRGARVAGFRVGIRAEQADGLRLEGCDVSGNFRQRLRSTCEREDEADWLWPHENDADEWERWGAGIWIADSREALVHGCRARQGQNGLVLDRVERSRVADNDFSFLSGWGVALWRSSENLIERNACDFCIRGYSHGVYNRGQDSAGILLFEQCSRNMIRENSATHCGDGLFAFAGREALGEAPAPEGFSYLRCGNNDNRIEGNDFSFAAAHGLELTFSFGNWIEENRLVENAICGIWGGYSRDTFISNNEFRSNGEQGSAVERGGINIEHGQRNVILVNRFRENACGVHLWWDEDASLAELPWALANGHASQDNSIIGNEFTREKLPIELRAAGRTFVRNSLEVGTTVIADEVSLVVEETPFLRPDAQIEVTVHARDLGPPATTRPVGARSHLAGREHIVMTEWGPYDWQSPLLQRLPGDERTHRYRMLGAAIESATVTAGRLELAADSLTITSDRAGPLSYELRVTANATVHVARGELR